ncbi:MAG: hypothetical protein ACK5EA_20525 [Planctomycetaceae bacterium]
MSDTSLERRLQTLEQQMQDVLKRLQSSPAPTPPPKDWRKSLGLFDDHPVMKQIDQAGQLVRQQDREQGAA